MAAKIRLARVGSKKNPIYRVVVADSRSPRDGKFIEIVGRYNPQTQPSTIEIDEAKVKDWISKGAQPTDSVKRLMKARPPMPQAAQAEHVSRWSTSWKDLVTLPGQRASSTTPTR